MDVISVRVDQCRVNFSPTLPRQPVSSRNKGMARILKRPTGKIQLSRVDRTRRHAIHSSLAAGLDDNCFRNRRLRRRFVALEIPGPVKLDFMYSSDRSMSLIDPIPAPPPRVSRFLANLLSPPIAQLLWDFPRKLGETILNENINECSVLLSLIIASKCIM